MYSTLFEWILSLIDTCDRKAHIFACPLTPRNSWTPDNMLEPGQVQVQVFLQMASQETERCYLRPSNDKGMEAFRVIWVFITDVWGWFLTAWCRLEECHRNVRSGRCGVFWISWIMLMVCTTCNDVTVCCVWIYLFIYSFWIVKHMLVLLLAVTLDVRSIFFL